MKQVGGFVGAPAIDVTKTCPAAVPFGAARSVYHSSRW